MSSSISAPAANDKLCQALVLVPTELERRRLEPAVRQALLDVGITEQDPRVRWAGCGFGPTIAGTLAAVAIARFRPVQVLLAGIAGSFDEQLALGEAFEPDFVAIEGIGAWDHERVRSPDELGWKLWQATGSDDPIFDCGTRLTLGPVSTIVSLDDSTAPLRPQRGLLTVCAASGSIEQAAARRRAFPSIVAEDMEGHAVAVACRITGVPLTIVRGISNIAGDRDHRRWRIDEALRSAARIVARRIAEPLASTR